MRLITLLLLAVFSVAGCATAERGPVEPVKEVKAVNDAGEPVKVTFTCPSGQKPIHEVIGQTVRVTCQ